MIRLAVILITLLSFIYQEPKQSSAYKILYIFPHPDDESYGPAGLMHRNKQLGNEVHLLTLTKGGATRMRFELNLSVEEMGKLRYAEMQDVKKTLDLNSMTVHDYPDGGLMEIDPREIENTIREHILRLEPNIIVTYPIHGISTHNDHIVTHAAVKRVFIELKQNHPYLKRLAFFHVTEEDNEAVPTTNFKVIRDYEIDAVVPFTSENVAAAHKALDCYKTYAPMIESSNIKSAFTKSLSLDFFRESFDEPVTGLTVELPN